MTYSDVVMWMWVAALLGTLAAFGCAWRSIARAQLAVAQLHTEVRGVDAVTVARTELDGATRAAAGERVRLHTRAADAAPEV